jgi:hypothetical protein
VEPVPDTLLRKSGRAENLNGDLWTSGPQGRSCSAQTPTRGAVLWQTLERRRRKQCAVRPRNAVERKRPGLLAAKRLAVKPSYRGGL